MLVLAVFCRTLHHVLGFQNQSVFIAWTVLATGSTVALLGKQCFYLYYLLHGWAVVGSLVGGGGADPLLQQNSAKDRQGIRLRSRPTVVVSVGENSNE